MEIYSYWVNLNHQTMPAYLKLCLRTWEIAIPDIRITIINHNNIQKYLPRVLLNEAFFALPLPMQSDIVSVWVLLSRGGLFMDVDTIITRNNIFSDNINNEKLYAFGYEEKQQIHLAVMLCKNKNNPLLYKWACEIAKKINAPLPFPVPWNFVGNAIINPLLQLKEHADHYSIIDAKSSGNILEHSYPHSNPLIRYLQYYFTPAELSLSEFIDAAPSGIVSLHNSWTPEIYKKASLKQIISSKERVMLSFILAGLTTGQD